MTFDNKTSAEIEREVQQQRDRIEARIGEIKERLSPGQLLDEALSYSRHGGAHFASNLGQQLTANPLPAALVGVGLAWLIGSSGSPASDSSAAADHFDDTSHPYANIGRGSLRRVRHAADDAGQWWSEFESEGGEVYRARATQMGERAGHFTDQAGRLFSGFIDDAGNRVRDFRDEAGNALSNAQGWASHSWNDLHHGFGGALNGLQTGARSAAGGLASGSRQLGSTVSSQAGQLGSQLATLFDQQPLIAGALAFAAGAAAGASLPHTAEEDQLLGQQGDKLRRKAGQAAGKLYDKGKEQAASLYAEATDKAREAYSEVKEQVMDSPGGLATH